MRKGKSRKGPSVIECTDQPQTMATFVNSRNAATTLLLNLEAMSENQQNIQKKHKEEAKPRMQKDHKERLSIRATLAGCIDPLDPDTHNAGEFLNICSCNVAHPDVNVHDALAIGEKQMEEFEASWPEGFYDKLSKKVVTFAAKTKHLVVNDKIVIDPEAVYARAIGLAVSNRESISKIS